jgi:hypothetical protein
MLYSGSGVVRWSEIVRDDMRVIIGMGVAMHEVVGVQVTVVVADSAEIEGEHVGVIVGEMLDVSTSVSVCDRVIVNEAVSTKDVVVVRETVVD